MERLNLNALGVPRSSFTSQQKASTFTIMLTLLMLYVAMDWTLAMITNPYLQATEEDDETGQILTAEFLYIPPWVITLTRLRQAWEFLYGLFVLLLLFRTRQYMRRRYAINHQNHQALEDCLCVFFCGPCTVCQGARHMSDPRLVSDHCGCPTGNSTVIQL